MKNKKLASLGASLFLALVWLACQGKVENSIATASVKPQRIVCASPALSEIVCALGLVDRIAGVSDFCDFPPEAAAKPKIGGFFNPNRERLLQLAPDLALGQGEMEKTASFCREQDIPFFSVRLDSLADIMDACRKVGAKVGEAEKGEALAEELEKKLSAIREKAEKLPRLKVFLVCGRSPGKLAGFMTVGKGTYLDDLLTLCGGDNIFADAPGLYPQVSREAVATSRPDAVVEIAAPGMTETDADKEPERTWKELAESAGLKGSRVIILRDGSLLKPGPRVAESAETIFRALHPETE